MNYVPFTRSRLYRLMAQRSSYYRYAVLIGACTLISCIWFYSCYKPAERYIHYYTSQIDELNKQRLQAQEQYTHNTQLHNTIGTLQQTTGPEPSMELPSAMALLEYALKAGLQLVSYTQDQPQENSYVQYISMHVALQGTLEQIRLFLMSLAQAPMIVQCKQLELSRVHTHLFLCSCTLTLATCTISTPKKDPSTWES